MDERKISLLGHIGELKKRLFRSALAVVITTAGSFFFANQIFAFLKAPAGNTSLIFIEMTEFIGTYMKVCLVSGLILAMPFITYQLIMFIAPALRPPEKKMLYLVMPWIIIMFAGGALFGYYVLIPPAARFLIGFGSDFATPKIRIGSYIEFVSRLLLAIGLVFELPVVTTFLAKIGIISSRWLANKRKIAIIGAFIVAAVITPTPDPINQTLVAVPLIILYEACIWLAKLVEKRKSAVIQLTDGVGDTATP
jgi:sec-independent protein translocase protein TatC